MKRFENKPTGIINSSDLKTVKGQLVYWTMFGVLVLTCAICVIPTIWVLFTGFKDTQEIYSSMSFFPENLTWSGAKESFLMAIKVMDFGRMSLNTLILSIGAVLFSLVFTGLGGYVLSRLKPTGTKLIFALMVWTMMMPEQIRTVPLFISWLDFPFVAKIPGEVSLMNTYWPMWLGYAASTFNIILFKNHFDSIPMSYVEAARLDGCGNSRIFFNIMIPLSVPIIIYVSIMVMKESWSSFFTSYLVLSDKRMQTLPVRIYTLSTDSTVKMNTYMLCLILSSLPMFIMFIFFQKHIIGGVNVGGVKG